MLTKTIGSLLDSIKKKLEDPDTLSKSDNFHTLVTEASIEYPPRTYRHKAEVIVYLDIVQDNIILVNGLNLSSKSWGYDYDPELVGKAIEVYKKIIEMIVKIYGNHILIYQTADDEIGHQSFIRKALLENKFKELDVEVISNETGALLKFYKREST